MMIIINPSFRDGLFDLKERTLCYNKHNLTKAEIDREK